MRRQLSVVLAALALLTGASGCGGESAPAEPAPPPISARPASDFDIYLLASAENNVLFADVYGLTLKPLALHRLTAGKRVSTMDANADAVAVAAADGDVDRLGYLGPAGEIIDVPGLGRPAGYAPRFAGKQLLFSDYYPLGPQQRDNYRYFRYDTSSGRKSLLFNQSDDLFGPLPLPGEQTGYIAGSGRKVRLLIKNGSRTVRSLPAPAYAGGVRAGARWVAFGVKQPGEGFNVPAIGLELLDPKTGERHPVDGWQPIAWTPDGKKLLVRRAGSTTDCELALLDPDRPKDQPEPLGTIPNLVVYSGAWVQRS